MGQFSDGDPFSEDLVRFLIDAAGGAVLMIDAGGTITDAGGDISAVIGHRPDALKRKHISSLFPHTAEAAAVGEKIEKGDSILRECHMLVDERGREFPALVSCRRLEQNKSAITIHTRLAADPAPDGTRTSTANRFHSIFNVAGIALFEEDFTELRTYVESLARNGVRNMEAYFSDHPDAIDRAADMVSILDVNDAAVRLYGAKHKRELIGSIRPLLTDGARSVFVRSLQAIADGEHSFTGESLHRTLDGREINVLVHSSIPGADDEYDKLVIGITDITDLRKAENHISSIERETAALLEHIPQCVCYLDTAGKIKRLNPAAEKHLGLTGAELHDLNFADLPIDGIDELMVTFRRVVETGEPVTNSILCMNTARGETWCSTDMTPIIENDCITGVIITSQDITALKDQEVRLKKSIEEKSDLVREIHHRVKNNMQVITSLLMLQADKTDDDSFKSMTRETINRIRSMGLIHALLYQSKSLSSIDFQDYIRELSTNLFFLYGIDREWIGITFDVDPIHLEIETAIPCGLVINELVSNCLKHAFPGDRRGTVTISLSKDAEGFVRLTVSDDGVGIGGDIDWRNPSTLGLRIIILLTEGQLGGRVELERTGGTTTTVTFPELR